MRLTDDELLFQLFVHGYSIAAIAEMWDYQFPGEDAQKAVEDAIRRAYNVLKQHKRRVRS